MGNPKDRFILRKEDITIKIPEKKKKGDGVRQAMKDELAAMVEEFYNQCNSSEDGRFCEGSDGPGRKRDAGKEDLGKKGTVQSKDNSLDKRAHNIVKTLVGKSPEEHAKKRAEEDTRNKAKAKTAEANRVKAMDDEEKRALTGRSDDIPDDKKYGGLSGGVKKKLDAKKFEKDIEEFKESIANETKRDERQASMGGSVTKSSLKPKLEKKLAEVEERYKKWRKAHFAADVLAFHSTHDQSVHGNRGGGGGAEEGDFQAGDIIEYKERGAMLGQVSETKSKKGNNYVKVMWDDGSVSDVARDEIKAVRDKRKDSF